MKSAVFFVTQLPVAGFELNTGILAKSIVFGLLILLAVAVAYLVACVAIALGFRALARRGWMGQRAMRACAPAETTAIDPAQSPPPPRLPPPPTVIDAATEFATADL